MKWLIYCVVLIVIISLYGCGGCPGEDEECPHGVWDDANCQCTCDNQICVHGYWDDPNCNCDCYDNWAGNSCNTFVPTPDFHADIAFNEDDPENFDHNVFDVEFRNGVLDTLWLDAYLTGANEQYVFLNLYLDDFSNASAGSSYPINGTYAPGNCWASVNMPSLNAEVFTPLGFSSTGTITIDTLSVNFDGNGTNFVSAHFDYQLYLLSGDSIHVVGYCDGAN